jgi:hypothetical protein
MDLEWNGRVWLDKWNGFPRKEWKGMEGKEWINETKQNGT